MPKVKKCSKCRNDLVPGKVVYTLRGAVTYEFCVPCHDAWAAIQAAVVKAALLEFVRQPGDVPMGKGATTKDLEAMHGKEKPTAS